MKNSSATKNSGKTKGVGVYIFNDDHTKVLLTQRGPVLGEYTEIIDDNGEVWEAKIFSATTTETPQIQEPTKCIGFGWFTQDDVQGLSLANYVVKDMQYIGWL